MAHSARDDDDAWHRRFAELAAQKQRLETDLSGKSAAFRDAMQKVTLENLLTALPPDVALVDYLEINYPVRVELELRVGLGIRIGAREGEFFVEEIVAGGGAAADGRLQTGDVIVAVGSSETEMQPVSEKLLADVVGMISGPDESKVFLKVRRGEDPEELVYAVERRPLPQQKRYDWTFHRRMLAFAIGLDRKVRMYDLPIFVPVDGSIDQWRLTYGMSAEARQAGAALRALVWDPVADAVAGARIVLVSPDGALGRFPLAALPGKTPDAYLIEEAPIALVPVPQLIPGLIADAQTT
jgi:hypothetical protein